MVSVQRLSLMGVHNKRLVVEAHSPFSIKGDDIVSSVWKHAAVHVNGIQSSDWVRRLRKHYGKKIKVFHYLPLLDDRNVNDQGINASGVTIADGNLYGSSKDVGTITSKLPLLTENGGEVNRVGFTRVTLEAELNKLGFFHEYTKESQDFDNEEDLYSHMSRETLRGAIEITEDVTQKDLLAGAGVIMYGGSATAVNQVSGETGAECIFTYELLMKMGIELDNNRCPKHTTIITGSRYTDTRTINSARYCYIGSELKPSLLRMKDFHNNKAFIPVENYASAGNIANGEIGAVNDFRFILVPEMQHWEGAGAAVTNNAGYRDDGSNYNVYPALVIGSGSFTNVGFQTNGKSVKFVIKHVAPESDGSYARDRYGEKGFMSIKWYYATLILRPEWIACAKVVAEI